jgi:hypothetical protein
MLPGGMMENQGFEVPRTFIVIGLIAAFFLQTDVAAASTSERMVLAFLVILALFGLEAIYRLVPNRWLCGIACGLLLGTTAHLWGKVLLPRTLSSAANERRCLAVQRDMLSAQPRRDDGPDLFQALGCRPQGEGSVFATPTSRASRPVQDHGTG